VKPFKEKAVGNWGAVVPVRGGGLLIYLYYISVSLKYWWLRISEDEGV
jgi:hypothetical protein